MQGAAPKQSLLMFVLQTGNGISLPIVALGGLLTLWGLINLAFVKNRGVLIAQALLSYAPLALSFLGLFIAFNRFLVLAAAAGPIDPEEVAQSTALGLMCGLAGTISTAVPGVIGVLAMARNLRRPATTFPPAAPHPQTASG
jgi:hypothetical protein